MTRDRVYLQHILDAMARITSYVAVGREQFMAATHWQDATIRQLEIIGEATKNISTPLREKYPDIPWRRVAGLRDVLIHNYMGVDLVAVWDITQTYLPEFRTQIERVIKEMA